MKKRLISLAEELDKKLVQEAKKKAMPVTTVIAQILWKWSEEHK